MKSQNRVIRQYEIMQITTPGAARLICLLHEKAVYFIKKGMIINSTQMISKAQNLIAVLDMSLRDVDEVSSLLHNLYSYSYHLLDKKDRASLKNACLIMNHLKVTFCTLSRHTAGSDRL
ncbi:flagellar protein FliS [Chitinispirillales bacterium ANBcel5]|uniref:flagellar protein FliS n=1 Tax=Cellulosispirillum alkaliphilum TaxID=3039283 RepID=UPI002A573D4B|nr:flagellar protein FliS [Chitinispirillales bacterium ANBcel5]